MIAGNHQKLEETRKESCQETSEKAWSCQHLDFGLLASRTEKLNFDCFKPVFDTCHGSPWKLIQPPISSCNNCHLLIIYNVWGLYNTLFYLYYLNYFLWTFYKDEKTKASIGHCKRASQKFQRKEEPQTSQNQQETINRFLKADYKELGT